MTDALWNSDRRGPAERVEDLLDYAQEQTSRIQRTTASSAGAMLTGVSIPGYVIETRLRVGGQGAVYKACHQATRRSVAIKIMPDDGCHHTAGRMRFSREVEVLAELRHPNIVRLADAGEVTGHFYFVTDFIDGEQLDAFVRRVQPDAPALLELFVKVCDAVHAAHLRGIVHRDLKPGNILVDQRGEPHVLDFGLAKLTGSAAAKASRWREITVTGQFVGSVPWAAPEQVAGDSASIDIRTDVYALGVIIYHALTGRFPYDVSGPPQAVIANIQTAEADASGLSSVGLHADLRTLVLKCLSKEPERRYQSAGELARDIRRYLNNEPIEAKRDSTLYVLSRTLRRHRRVVAGLVVILLLLVAGIAASTTFAYRAHREAQRSYAALDLLEQVFLPMHGIEDNDAPELQAFFEDRLVKAQNIFRDDQLQLAKLNAVLAGVHYQRRKDYPAALDLFQQSYDIYRTRLGEDHPAVAELANALASTLAHLRRFAEAEPLLRSALDSFRARYGRDDWRTVNAMNSLAYVLTAQTKISEAEPVQRECLALQRRALGNDRWETQFSVNRYAHLLMWLGELEQAEPLFREYYEFTRDNRGPDDGWTINALELVGHILLRRDKLEEAELRYREAIALRRQRPDGNPLYLAADLAALADALVRSGRHGEAATLAAEALRLRIEHDAEDWLVTEAEGILAASNARDASIEETERILERSLRVIQGARGEYRWRTQRARQRLDTVRRTLGDEH